MAAFFIFDNPKTKNGLAFETYIFTEQYRYIIKFSNTVNVMISSLV